MKIVYYPQNVDAELNLKVQGDVLLINGCPADFSQLQDNQKLEDPEAFPPGLLTGVQRDGILTVSITLPIDASADENALFPQPTTVSSGLVTLPTHKSVDMPLGDPIQINFALVEVLNPPPGPVILYPADLWRRVTDAEAEQIDAVMQTQPFRIRQIFNTAQVYRSDDELWPLLVSIATQLFGAERASEILAPSQ